MGDSAFDELGVDAEMSYDPATVWHEVRSVRAARSRAVCTQSSRKYFAARATNSNLSEPAAVCCSVVFMRLSHISFEQIAGSANTFFLVHIRHN